VTGIRAALSGAAASSASEHSVERASDRLRVNNFDLLRLAFAAMVMVFHTGVLSEVPSLTWMGRAVSPTFAVQAFFFVSGFLVTMSYEKSSSLRSYAEKRFRRIAPAYAVVVLGATLFFSPLSELPLREYFTHTGVTRYVFFNLLLSNYAAPSLPGVFLHNPDHAIDGSLWTIKVEVAFYAIVPIVVLLTRRYGRMRTLVMVFVLSLVWRLGLMAIGRYTGNAFYGKLAIQAPGQLAYFVTGALAYYRTSAGLGGPTWWMAILGVLGYWLTTGLVHELTAPFLVAAFVYWAAISLPKIPVDVNRYGDISYGMYLYHWPLIQVLIAVGLFAYSPWMAALAVFVGNTAFSYLSWHLVEKRFLGHRRHAAPQSARPSSATT